MNGILLNMSRTDFDGITVITCGNPRSKLEYNFALFFYIVVVFNNYEIYFTSLPLKMH